MTKKRYFSIVLILDVLNLMSGATLFQCNSGLYQSFDKRLATRPSKDDSLREAVFVIRDRDASGQSWSSLECVRKCQGVRECHSVVVLHKNMECVGLPYTETRSLIQDNDANYFVKICVDETCRNKLWSTESSYGYRLISQTSLANQASTVTNITDEGCSQYLLRSNGNNNIRSAQFQLQHPPTIQYGGPNGQSNIDNFSSVMGTCVLSLENKFTEPESFRVASGDYWYKENQCVEDLPKNIDRCSYEEYYNQTLKHYDVMVQGISTQECKTRCENENQFNCRGFTTVPFERGKNQLLLSLGSDDKSAKICYLHSEDTLTHGSWLLTRVPESVYYRRVTCLNVSVVCTPTGMSVTYRPRTDFRGRLYASGYSETCSVAGLGRSVPTTLLVPFNHPDCGVNQAFALDDGEQKIGNKTLMYTLLVIQNNPIIQAQGDRFVRVGCVAPPSLNLTLGADISVGKDGSDKSPEGSASIPASSIINSTGSQDTPKVRMYIINDPDAGDPTAQVNGGAVSLGETIELRIESEFTKSDVDIHAYHLVASSQLGDSSVLLLDGRGCPTGQVDFPSLVHTRLPPGSNIGFNEKGGNFWTSGTSGRFDGNGTVGSNFTNGAVRLSARFRAFRFPNSHVVKFSVMVQFCPGACEKIVCESMGRNARNVQAESRMDFGEQVFQPTPDVYSIPYENASITFLDQPLARENPSRSAQIVVASSENNGRVAEMCREINESQRRKIPLELSLIVASNDVLSADSLIYGENNKILVAAVEDPRVVRNNMICIHEALFISLTVIWLLVQVIILVGCMFVIKRYRTFVEENHLIIWDLNQFLQLEESIGQTKILIVFTRSYQKFTKYNLFKRSPISTLCQGLSIKSSITLIGYMLFL